MKWKHLALSTVELLREGNPDYPTIDRVGLDGWELVSVDDGIAYFKRPLEEIPPAIVLISTDGRDAQDLADEINRRYLRRPPATELKTVDTGE